VRWPQGTANPGESAFVFVAVQLLRMDGVSSSQFFCSEEIHIRLTFRVFSRLQGARVGFFVSSADGATILEAYDSDRCDAKLEREPGEYIVSAVIPDHLLNEGSYLVGLNAGIPGVRNLSHLENVLSFRIDNQDGVGAFFGEKRSGCILPILKWNV